MLNTITVIKTLGVVPALMWTLGNVSACIVFGYIITKLPELKRVVDYKAVRYALSFMAVFQIWLNMNGICEVFGTTAVGRAGGQVIAYAVAVGFTLLLLIRGMIRNVLTDCASWIMVYALIAVVTLMSYWANGVCLDGITLGVATDTMRIGLGKALLLVPGPFTFVYFYELIRYNDNNTDGVVPVNMTRAFTIGGLLFGIYIAFAFSLAFTQFTPALEMAKAMLISLVAVSSISTFIYSMYIVFGRTLGLIIDVAVIALWSAFVDMGVMGVWTLMASIRIYIVAAMIAIALWFRH